MARARVAAGEAQAVGKHELRVLRGELNTRAMRPANHNGHVYLTTGEVANHCGMVEDLVGGDVIACAYADLPRYFATFLPLAGISTVKEIKNNPIDVKATGGAG